MAEPSRYVSLRDLLEKEPPKHRFTYHLESTTTDDEDDDYEEDFSLRSVMMRKPASPLQPKPSDVPGQVSRADPVTCKDKGKNKIIENDRKGRTDKASKRITSSARFSSMRHSRSDDPLVYMGRRDKDDFDVFDSAEDLKTASTRLMNFSLEEMNLKSSVASDSDDN